MTELDISRPLLDEFNRFSGRRSSDVDEFCAVPAMISDMGFFTRRDPEPGPEETGAEAEAEASRICATE